MNMNFIILNENDNVGVASGPVTPGQTLTLPDGETVEIRQDVPVSHKIAIRDINAGDEVIRYGEPIGKATENIRCGNWVHTHNLTPPDTRSPDNVIRLEPKGTSLDGPATFQGYARARGPAGIRNHLLVLPTVSCANGVVRAAGKAIPEAVAVEHAGGCGRGGVDNDRTMRSLVGLGTHPNVAAVVLVGLGCEVIQGTQLAGEIEKSGRPVRFFSIQDVGGTRKATELVINACREMLPDVEKQERTPQPVSDLMIGLECGGSDALSGVTANPAVGLVSDWLVDRNATAILTETTELIGADHLLAARCRDKTVAKNLAAIIEKNRRISVEMLGEHAHVAISPGNQDGGLSTIMEKSLGCVTKGGSSTIEEVVQFSQAPSRKGLIIMDAPGYDVESITGVAAGGCQAIFFTTGRGTPAGNVIAPTIKISSNTPLWEKMEDDLDFNCGDIISDNKDINDVAQELLELLIETADGKVCKSEINDTGDCVLSFTSEAL